MWNKYTIELRTLLEDEVFEVFSFDYDFYTDDPKIRAKFEQKFKDHYLFDEICCSYNHVTKFDFKFGNSDIFSDFRKIYTQITEIRKVK